jgi:hypothetical protein
MNYKKKDRFLNELLNVNYSFNYFEFDELFEKWKEKKKYFIEQKEESEIRFIYECFIFYHYCVYNQIVLDFIDKNDIKCIIKMKNEMRNTNDDDLLYLYGFYKLSIDELSILKPSKTDTIFLRNRLEELKLKFDVTKENFRCLSFLLWVKQGSRRLYLNEFMIISFFNRFEKYGFENEG